MEADLCTVGGLEMESKKVVIYGLGREFPNVFPYLESIFDIVGFSDSNPKEKPEKFIEPEHLNEHVFDYIYITSEKYFNEIRASLLERFGSKIEDKIISGKDVFEDFSNSSIRDQWIIRKLQEIPSGKTLLDAGAGMMRYKPYCRHLQYIAQDFGKYDPFSAPTGLHENKAWDTSGVDITCDIIDIPLEDGTMDAILCSEVLEHLKNPILAVKEFGRILKKGGVLLLTAPVCSLTHQAPHYYSNGFSEYWYRENLKDYGFVIEEMTPNGDYFKYLGQELFRIKDMAKKYCHKELTKEELKNIMACMKTVSALSGADTASYETLCFGFMVVARKI